MANSTDYAMKYSIEYWFQNNDDYDFDIIDIEANDMQDIHDQLQAIRGHYIKPRHIKVLSCEPVKNALDDKFDNPINQLDDIFESFASIFAPKPFHADRKANYKKASDESK